MTEKQKKFFGRLKYVLGEFPFLEKGQPPIIKKIRMNDGKMVYHSETDFAYRSHNVCASYVNGRQHGIYADRCGTIMYHFKGVLVPPHYILDPSSLKWEEVSEHPNAEVRRVGCEIYGFDRMMDEKLFTILDKDKKGNQLLCRKTKDGDVKVIRVLDGTVHNGERKIYFLNVPPEMTKCHDAIAWTFYKKPEEYDPIQET